jgi:hypothetical protein
MAGAHRRIHGSFPSKCRERLVVFPFHCVATASAFTFEQDHSWIDGIGGIFMPGLLLPPFVLIPRVAARWAGQSVDGSECASEWGM